MTYDVAGPIRLRKSKRIWRIWTHVSLLWKRRLKQLPATLKQEQRQLKQKEERNNA